MSKFITLLLVLLNYGEQSLATSLHGARARNDQFPWLIQFQTIVPCGGILISPDWVLTAAQCVQYKRNSITLYAAGLNGTGSSQMLGVKATYIFPHYKAYSTMHDREHNIALLKLVKPFDMCNDKVQLPDVARGRLDKDYKTCLIFGWQSYVAPSTKVLAKPIQYTHVLLNNWELCMYVLKSNTSYNNVFCTMTESENSIQACAGNPGSPVVCEDQYQRMILLGIASWSNFSLDCGGIPTYLGVSVFRSWIHNLIFIDKKIQKLHTDGKSTSKDVCGHNRYLEHVAAETNTRKYLDSLESKYLQVNVNKDSANRVWNSLNLNPEEKNSSTSVRDILSNVENGLPIKDYSKLSSKYGIPFDIVRERDDNLQPYHEIGHGKGVLGGIENFIALPAEESKFSLPKKQNILKQSKMNNEKGSKLEFDDEIDDSGSMGTLEEDYFIGRSYSLHFCSKKRSLFSILFLGSSLIVL